MGEFAGIRNMGGVFRDGGLVAFRPVVDVATHPFIINCGHIYEYLIHSRPPTYMESGDSAALGA